MACANYVVGAQNVAFWHEADESRTSGLVG
jgi:hypothetical protein